MWATKHRQNEKGTLTDRSPYTRMGKRTCRAPRKHRSGSLSFLCILCRRITTRESSLGCVPPHPIQTRTHVPLCSLFNVSQVCYTPVCVQCQHPCVMLIHAYTLDKRDFNVIITTRVTNIAEQSCKCLSMHRHSYTYSHGREKMCVCFYKSSVKQTHRRRLSRASDEAIIVTHTNVHK